MFLTEDPKWKKYSERIKKAFPSELENEVTAVVKILPFENHKVKLNDGKFREVANLIHSDKYEVNLNSKKLIIPYRLYFDEPSESKEEELTEIEKEILNCIYLRHCNGYLREKRLKNLMKSQNEFVIPFTIQLLGEYVFEILENLDKHISGPNLSLYQKFVKENPRYWQITESRVGSYWNAYYRHKSHRFKNYLGYKLIRKIK